MSCKIIIVFFIFITVCYIATTESLHASPALSKERSCEKRVTTLAQQGKPHEAVTVMNQCIKQNPLSTKSHVVLGFLHLQINDLQQALVSFDKALELRPMSSGAKIGKGIVLSKNGDLKAAEIILKEGLKLNPKPSRAHYELGLIYEQKGDLEQALFHFKLGISTYEKNNM